MKLRQINGGVNNAMGNADKSENVERETMEKIVQVAQAGQIPIIKNLPKGAERSRANFRIDAQTDTLLTILTVKSKTFSTKTELQRAIIEFGTKIFYHLFKDESSEMNTVGKKIFAQLENIHNAQKEQETLAICTRSAKSFYDRAEMKIITKRKMETEHNKIINSLSESLQSEMRSRIKKIKKGVPITEFLVDKNDYTDY